MTTYPTLLKEWRKKRRLSQLDLAVEAGVSARHISFLETGRSRPSADMIVHLSEVMDVPVTARNRMMRAVGFAPRYQATPLDEDAMEPIRDAIHWTLARHAPYPGLAMDRLWTLRMLNEPAKRLFAPLGVSEGSSMLALLTNPTMPQVVENWPEVAHYTALRLRAESEAAGGLAQLDAAVAHLAPQASLVQASQERPSIPTIYRFGDQRLSLFATIAQFSTVNDETLDDFKVELFFPADAESGAILEGLASSD